MNGKYNRWKRALTREESHEIISSLQGSALKYLYFPMPDLDPDVQRSIGLGLYKILGYEVSFEEAKKNRLEVLKNVKRESMKDYGLSKMVSALEELKEEGLCAMPLRRHMKTIARFVKNYD